MGTLHVACVRALIRESDANPATALGTPALRPPRRRWLRPPWLGALGATAAGSSEVWGSTQPAPPSSMSHGRPELGVGSDAPKGHLSGRSGTGGRVGVSESLFVAGDRSEAPWTST